MNFTPKTEDEIEIRAVLKNGDYDFTVTQATDEKSQAGNDQIHLVLKVEDANRQFNVVHDYLLEAMAGKLRHFCAAVGLMEEYESGSLTAGHCTNQTGRVKLAIEPAKGQYAEKNVVRDYLVDSAPAQRQSPPRSATPPATASVGTAKNAWLVVWNRFVGEFPAEAPKRAEAWKKCFTGYFPGKSEAVIPPGDWARFQNDVGKWDVINGWPAKENPFGSDTFDESDIPF